MNEGQNIGHYTIIRQLGKGGMGEVYLAEDTKLRREVAIKVLPERLRNNQERLRRFRREAEAAAKLKHNNIATIYALEDFDDLTCIVMEHVEGDRLMVVKVSTNPNLKVEAPQPLFVGGQVGVDLTPINMFGGHRYDVSPDGERFVMVYDGGPATVHVWQNWYAEFKDR